MQIGRSLRTLDIDVGGYNLCEEVLSWLDFPVNNPTEKDHFLTPTEGIKYIDSRNTSLDELLEMLPDSRRNAEEIRRLVDARVIDSTYNFDVSKVR